jgi:hypothetical protein
MPMNIEGSVGAHGLCFVIYSDDNAESWQYSEIVDNQGNTCEEPAVQAYD